MSPLLNHRDWLKADELFNAALDLPPNARIRWLEEVCEHDAALGDRVEKLLALSSHEDDMLRPCGAMTGSFWEEVARELEEEDDEETLSKGERVGSYEVIDLLGTGGMGKVYRAKHPGLEREVAVKSLSSAFVSDTSSLRRFEREAKLLAGLNHPNIAVVYDLLFLEDKPFLILELVEGETLQQRLSRGALEIDEVLTVATQLVDALDEAHRKGVIHRDLKPSNVKLTREGRVKVLDFGLAKSQTTGTEPADPRTASLVTTQSGMVLGTPGYMSPEQARGQSVDKRADIWAFGCLLYEMLTGKRAFSGSTVSDVIAAVLRDDVDWDRLPAKTPPELRRLTRLCLRKEPDDRLKDLSDARADLLRLTSGVQAKAHERVTRLATNGWLVAAALVLIAVTAAYLFIRPSRNTVPKLTNAVQVTSAVGREDFPAWSSDGKTLAYAAMQDSPWDIWITQFDGGQPLNRTSDHSGSDFSPSWSPDGKQIAFRSNRDGGGIFVMSPFSGAPRKIVDAVTVRAAPQWSPDGTELHYVVLGEEPDTAQILEIFSLRTGDVRRMSLPGRWLCRCEIALSPDGRFLAYIDAQGSASQISQLWLLRLEDGEAFRLTDGTTSDWSPSWSDGSTLYFVSNRGGIMDLWQQRLRDDGTPDGPSRAVTVGVGMQRAAFSPDGKKLAYSRGRRMGNLYRVPILEGRPATWSDAEQLTFDEALVEFIDLSPEGDRLVLSSDRAGNPDLWVLPLDGGEMQQLTADPTPDWLPAFSRDGNQVAFYAYRSGNRDLWVMPAKGGPARQVTRDEASDLAPSWSPDGKELLFYTNRNGSADIYSVSIHSGREEAVIRSPDQDRFPKWSPDGKWIAFTVAGAGRRGLYKVSTSGGLPIQLTEASVNYSIWAPDGRVIYYNLGRGHPDDIWRIHSDGTGERPVTDFTGRRGRLGREALATDGRYLYFTWENDVGDIWVIDVVSANSEQ